MEKVSWRSHRVSLLPVKFCLWFLKLFQHLWPIKWVVWSPVYSCWILKWCCLNERLWRVGLVIINCWTHLFPYCAMFLQRIWELVSTIPPALDLISSLNNVTRALCELSLLFDLFLMNALILTKYLVKWLAAWTSILILIELLQSCQ